MSQPHPGKPEAADAIWQRHGSNSDDARLPTGNVRIGGTIRALISASFGVGVYLIWSQTVGTIVLCIAGIIFFSAIVSPNGLYRGLQGLFGSLGNFTGRVLTWLMLVPLFYLFFLPFGKLMRRGQRDALKRKLEPESESYWEVHKEFSPADLDRQF